MSKRFIMILLTVVSAALALYAEEPIGIIRFDLEESSEEDASVVARPKALRIQREKIKRNAFPVVLSRNI